MVTGINEPYLQNAKGFIESMNQKSNVKNIVITLDFTAAQSLCETYPNVAFIHLSSAQVKAPNPNTCMQHGGFLSALKHVADDAIIIFTDADIIIQRGFTTDELEHLISFQSTDIGVGHNAAPTQTLTEEMKNLSPRLKPKQIKREFPDIDNCEVYNTGVIAIQKKTYEQLYELYVKDWNKVESAFGHYAKQQWLLSYLIQNHFNVRILTDEIHTHDHHPIELRVTREFGHKFCIENTPVLFAHHISQIIPKETWEKKIKCLKKTRLKWQRIGISAIGLSIILLILLITDLLD